MKRTLLLIATWPLLNFVVLYAMIKRYDLTFVSDNGINADRPETWRAR